MKSVNGLNLYAYCFNNSVNYKQRLVSSDSSVIDSTFSAEGSFVTAVGSSGGGNFGVPQQQ